MTGNHWTVFNGAGGVVCDNMPMDVAQAYITPERAKRGWTAVYCLIVRDPADFPAGVPRLDPRDTVRRRATERRHVMRWIPVTERLPEGDDAISCEAWCEAEEPSDVAGPCIMSFDADAKPGEDDQWTPREDTGCWEPGPVTHWRPRPTGPGCVGGTDGR